MARSGLLPHDYLPTPEEVRGAPAEALARDGMAEVVELEQPGMLPGAANGVTFAEGDNGDTIVDFAPGEDLLTPGGAMDANDHYANLAEFVDESALDALAQEVCEGVEADENSRKDWHDRLARGLELLGLKDVEDSALGPLKVAKAAHHPLLAEAQVQFQARAYAELFPPKGPAKGLVLGNSTREREDQATRVSDYINYQLTVEDRAYLEESDQLLFMVSMEGSEFKKCSHDPVRDMNVSRWVRGEDFLVPYSATSLETAPRYTHRFNESHNEFLKKQRAGLYRDVEIPQPASTSGGNESTAVTIAKDAVEGKTPQDRPEDAEHTMYEQHLDWNLKGFEDLDEEGKPTGVALPYIVFVEKESQKVLGIYRNWREKDQTKKLKRVWFAHYKFLPGTGFYGFGFLHTIGGLSAAATACLRIILTGAIYSSVPGGLKTKDARVAGNIEIEPGVFKDVESTAEELSKAFWSPDFKQPSEALFKVLGLLTELGQRFAQTHEAVVGDAKNTGPVGTTIALIEQGSKVFSGIHRRMHTALGYELRLLAELNGHYMPDEGYPYEVPGASRQVFKEDFDDRVDIVPVSDPNIHSSTQRIAIAQTKLELANAAPDLFDRREAFLDMLRAVSPNDADTERLMPERAKAQRCDPITENTLAMVGRPIRVYPGQHDEAHIIVHMGALQMMAAQGSAAGEFAQQALIAHVAEHEAYKMRKEMMMAMGVKLPPVDIYAEPGKKAVQFELPPQIEDQIAVRAAQVMQAMLAQLQAAQAVQQQAAAGPEGEAEHQVEEQRKDESAKRAEQRKDLALQSQIDRDDAKAGLDPATVKAAGSFLAERGLERAITPRALAVTARALGKPFEDVVRMIMYASNQGQGMGPAPMASRISPGGGRAPL
jgi:hypothetical protein